MNRLNALAYSPFTIGFDNVFDRLDSMLNTNVNQGYPPYNIIKTSDVERRLDIAIAGFKPEDIDIAIEDNTLIIKGEHNDEEVDYVHKGISSRKFERRFVLGDHTVVKEADLVNGTLQITMEEIVPEEKKPRKIKLKSISSSDSNPELLNE